MSGSRSLGALAGMIRRFTAQGGVRGVQKGWEYPQEVCGRGGQLSGPRVAVGPPG